MAASSSETLNITTTKLCLACVFDVACPPHLISASGFDILLGNLLFFDVLGSFSLVTAVYRAQQKDSCIDMVTLQWVFVDVGISAQTTWAMDQFRISKVGQRFLFELEGDFGWMSLDGGSVLVNARRR